MSGRWTPSPYRPRDRVMSFVSLQSAIEEPHRGLGMRCPVMRRRNSEGLKCAHSCHRIVFPFSCDSSAEPRSRRPQVVGSTSLVQRDERVAHERIQDAFRRDVERIWVHTCSLDHKHALDNYLSRGLKIFRKEEIDLIP